MKPLVPHFQRVGARLSARRTWACPTPAVAGLDDELRTIGREKLGARHPAYLRSRLSLTEFGRAVVAHEQDFSRHNPIDRWWGGTHLTDDQLWRYDQVLTRP